MGLVQQSDWFKRDHLLGIADQLSIDVGRANVGDLRQVALHIGDISRDVLSWVALRITYSEIEFSVGGLDRRDVTVVIDQLIRERLIGLVIRGRFYNPVLKCDVDLVGINHFNINLLAGSWNRRRNGRRRR